MEWELFPMASCCTALLHPEGGHVLLTRHPKDTYGGKCPYHSNCLEGLAAGPAIEARWGKKGIELADKKRGMGA